MHRRVPTPSPRTSPRRRSPRAGGSRASMCTTSRLGHEYERQRHDRQHHVGQRRHRGLHVHQPHQPSARRSRRCCRQLLSRLVDSIHDSATLSGARAMRAEPSRTPSIPTAPAHWARQLGGNEDGNERSCPGFQRDHVQQRRRLLLAGGLQRRRQQQLRNERVHGRASRREQGSARGSAPPRICCRTTTRRSAADSVRRVARSR